MVFKDKNDFAVEIVHIPIEFIIKLYGLRRKRWSVRDFPRVEKRGYILFSSDI